MIVRYFSFALLVMLLLAPACTKETKTKDWEEDINYLKKYYPELHLDFDQLMDVKAFRRDLDQIAERVPQLTEHKIVLELQQVLARLGVSHSGLLFYFGGIFNRVPIQLELFDDGLFLTRLPSWGIAGPEHRIVEINGFPVDTVLNKLGSYISHENTYWRDAMLPHLLVMPMVLDHAGLGVGTDSMTYLLQNGELLGARSNAQLGDMAFLARLQGQPWRELKNKYYWYKILEGTLYLQYNTCREDPDMAFPDFVDMLTRSLDEEDVKRFILDLRLNQGGNSNILKPMTEALKQYPQLDYFVAMSRQTFSSGTFAVRDFKQELGATLIGEPTGGSPVSYGEVKSLQLPNSGFQVNYCVKYFRLLESNVPYFEPDISIPYLSDDYFAGRDPVLEYLMDIP